MMSITKENKKDIISKFAINKNDTGSVEVQIAVISERIKNLTEHFKNHKHDNHSKRGLLQLVNKRKKLLIRFSPLVLINKSGSTSPAVKSSDAKVFSSIKVGSSSPLSDLSANFCAAKTNSLLPP